MPTDPDPDFLEIVTGEPIKVADLPFLCSTVHVIFSFIVSFTLHWLFISWHSISTWGLDLTRLEAEKK